MSVKRIGIAGFVLAIGFSLIAPATSALAGCSNNEGPGFTCSPRNFTITVSRDEGTTFTATDYNFGTPTIIQLVFPPSGTGSFVFSFSMNKLNICTLVLPCGGSGIDLGTVPSGYTSANPITLNWDIAPPDAPPVKLIPGWYTSTLPVPLPELPCLLVSLLPVPCNVSQAVVGGHYKAVDHVQSGDPRIGHN